MLLEEHTVDIIIIGSTALGSLIRVFMRWSMGKPNIHRSKEAIKIMAVSILTHGIRAITPICIGVIDCKFNIEILARLEKNWSVLYALFMLLGYFNRELVDILTEVSKIIRKKIIDKIVDAFS